MRVLLVDDDGDQLSLRGMLVRQSGFETCEAIDSRSALQMAADYPLDCAVIDLHLPTEQAGLELIGRLKSSDPALHLIVLTGRASKSLAGVSRELVNEVLIKGSSARELIKRLKRICPRQSD